MPKYKEYKSSDEKYLKDFDDFCVYTIKILKDPEICPKSARWLGASEIVDITQKLHTSVHHANNVKVTYPKEKELRHTLQTNAWALIQTLGEKFTFCSDIYNISVDKLDKWLGRKGEIQTWLSRWIKSEEKRYQNIG